ncbi:MAG: sigma-54 dependent transcriptional regulator [Bacteroidota bacterium]|nr:sigma-54 dependent transcriptional regulator [Bacteroidota bacterium]
MTAIQNKIQAIKNRYQIVGASPMLNNAIEKAIKVAPTDISVLISGESGVGKENFSKIIHQLSKRKHGNLIAINCAAIPSGTIDSELFGHEKGSFTSAYDSRKGYFETANGGTIFLDEISELPLETQSRLLRVLESGEFIKVGSSKVLKTDIRLIAASNKDLLEKTKKNKFREDLYYRLNTVNIHIPPLRNRKEDIPMLFAKFASDFSDKYKIPPLELDNSAMEMLKQQYWPGNIRQFRNTIEQISILGPERLMKGKMMNEFLPVTPGKELIKFENDEPNPQENINDRDLLYKFLIDIKKDVSEAKTIMLELAHGIKSKEKDFESSIEYATNKLIKAGNNLPDAEYEFIKQEKKANENNSENNSYSESQDITDIHENLSLADQEKSLIIEALKKYRGKRKPAAKELGISERTLYRKIKEYELEEM